MKSYQHTFKRDFRKNLSFYISIGLLTMFTVFLSAVGFTDAIMITEDVSSLMDTCHVEDAQFLTALPLSEDDIANLEEKYQTRVEQDAYMDAEDGDKTFRFFRPMEKVNQYSLLEGEDVKTDNDILLDRDFANANELEIGDIYRIDGEDFRISGLAVRPDYLYSKKSESDPWVDKENFAMVQVTPEAYDKLREEHTWEETTYYSVEYEKESLSDDFRDTIYHDYSAYVYTAANANSRIQQPANAGKTITTEAFVLIPILVIVILLLVSIVIGRMLEREQKYVGTMTALGYRKREIGVHYMIYAMIPGVLGSVLGLILALFCGKGVAMYFVIDYQRINYNYYIRPVVAILCLLLPAVLFGLVAYWKTVRMLRRSVVSMLTERDDRKTRNRGMLKNSNMNFRSKFRIRELFSHMGRTLLVLFCLFLSSFLCLDGFAMRDMVDVLVDQGAESASVYDYTYYLNHMDAENKYEGYHGITASFETTDNHAAITLTGVPADSAFDDIAMKEGIFSSKSGYYISNAVSVERDLHKGDTLTIANTVTLEETEVKIDGVVADNTQQVIYTSYENAKDVMGLDGDYYNIVYSNEKIDIDSDDLAYLSDNESMLDTFENAMTAFSAFINGMMFMGCLMSVISVYLIVNMLIEENKSSISMLKVLGYRDREINGIVLNVNHILVVLGFLLAVPACVSMLGGVSSAMVSVMHVVLEPTVKTSSVLICGVIILISYFFSLLLLRRKVSRIDMVVSLKGNRE